jgi:alkylation response protein AidB-like acyl-CoA dehydrogenase
VDFDLTEEQIRLREAARDFIRKECTPEVIRRSIQEGRHSDRLWRRMAELGWLGVAIEERYGGSGGPSLTWR